jgi:hypothetical protein
MSEASLACAGRPAVGGTSIRTLAQDSSIQSPSMMIPMQPFRTPLLFLLAAFLLSGCVSTLVVSKTSEKLATPVEQFVLLVKTGQFLGSGVASRLGQENLDSLVPHLVTRLPAIFTLNNLPMKVAPSVFDESTMSGKTKVLIVKPISATYSSRAGQMLNLRAEILDVKTSTYIWSADIRLHTLGFGKFDEKLAEDVAVKLLTQLRSDGVISLPEGEPKTI